MPVLYQDYVYSEDSDVLIRVYPNHLANPDENELFCGKILFRDPSIPHVRFTAPLPRGLVHAVKTNLHLIPKPWNIQVSNELFYQVGLWTSCREHFDKRIRRLLVNDGLDYH